MVELVDWRQRFPCLAGMSDHVVSLVEASARQIWFSEGTQIFGPDRPAPGLILPLSGTVCAERSSGEGRRRVFYHADDDTQCALLAACHLTFDSNSAEAATDVDCLVVPTGAFNALMAVSSEFRAYMFASCSNRITELSLAIEEAAGKRVEVLLAAKLAEWNGQSTAVLNHHSLSIDLGTAPSVIAQHLGEFERRGWVSLKESKIEIINLDEIRRLATMHQGSVSNASCAHPVIINQSEEHHHER